MLCEISSQTLFLLNWLCSSCIARYQFSSLEASLMFFNSTCDTNITLMHNCPSCLLVDTPLEISPIIFSIDISLRIVHSLERSIVFSFSISAGVCSSWVFSRCFVTSALVSISLEQILLQLEYSYYRFYKFFLLKNNLERFLPLLLESNLSRLFLPFFLDIWHWWKNVYSFKI